MSLDELFSEVASRGYLFDLKQSPRGWDIFLWHGAIGYSRYVTTTYHTTPHSCILAALRAADSNLWSEPDCAAIPTCAPSDLDAALANLLTAPPITLSKPLFKLKTK